MLTFGLMLGRGPAGPGFVHADQNASIAALPECNRSQSQQFELRPTIAFASSRGDPTTLNTEIYLMPTKDDGTPDPTAVQPPLTSMPGNAFAALSPDGKKIVFDSNREVQGLPTNISDLFVMNADGTEQTVLTRHSSSATWSPDCKYVAFHASASGLGKPSANFPGAATTDSDIFVLNVDDCLKVKQDNGVDDCRLIPGEHVKNITNSPHNVNAIDGTPACPATSPGYRNEDADWSFDGTMIAFTRRNDCENGGAQNIFSSAELYVMRVSPNGTPVQDPQCLTCLFTDPTIANREERAPAWSPDGKRILYQCRRGSNPGVPFALCVLDKDQVGNWRETRLTPTNQHLTPSWSPDGAQILFHKQISTATNPGCPSLPLPCYQLFLIKITTNPDGTLGCDGGVGTCTETRLTDPPGFNAFAKWGVARVHVKDPKETQPSTGGPAAPPVPQRR